MTEFINYNRLKKEIRSLSDADAMRVIQVVACQRPVDVIPVDFIQRYAEDQDRGGCNQLAIHALLGAWIIEKGKRENDR